MNEFDTNRSINYARENFEFDKHMPENKNMYDKPRKRMSKPAKTVLIVIAAIVCAYILYSVLVNPMTQLKFERPLALERLRSYPARQVKLGFL